jgi:hypothetical protein
LQEKQDAKMDILVAAEERRQGQWRIVALAGGFAGAAMAFLANFLETWKK